MVTKNEMVAILAALTTDFDSEPQEREAEQETDLQFGQAHLESEKSHLEQQRKVG